ncbi:hypothetical protein LZ32DRAFT_295380 [Colletotrichum eremochloae]|nr:hypothetical protein LZ32DRAFT_295380 [Colletotrichum eremochloae]
MATRPFGALHVNRGVFPVLVFFPNSFGLYLPGGREASIGQRPTAEVPMEAPRDIFCSGDSLSFRRWTVIVMRRCTVVVAGGVLRDLSDSASERTSQPESGQWFVIAMPTGRKLRLLELITRRVRCSTFCSLSGHSVTRKRHDVISSFRPRG